MRDKSGAEMCVWCTPSSSSSSTPTEEDFITISTTPDQGDKDKTKKERKGSALQKDEKKKEKEKTRDSEGGKQEHNKSTDKKVHFADGITEASPVATQAFECKQLKQNVVDTCISSVLQTAEFALSSNVMEDHYRICKCLTMQLDSLAVMRNSLGKDKAHLDLSDLYRAILIRLEKISSFPMCSTKDAKMQLKTTKKLCKLLSRIHSNHP